MSGRTPFFVTGLPRSRTAWMANWLTTDRTLCYHDQACSAELLRADRLVGFSGSELAEQFGAIAVRWPAAPWVVMLRDSGEALEAFKRWAGPRLPDGRVVDAWWQKRRHLISGLCAHPVVFPVTIQMLQEEHVARNAWYHLLPEIPFDLARWTVLKGFNVQQQLDDAELRRRIHAAD